MPFEINKGKTYEWPIPLGEPRNGASTDEQFTGIFLHLTQEEIEEINEKSRKRQLAVMAGESVENMITDADIARQVLVGWSGITDGGNPVPYTEELKETLLKRNNFAAFVVMAWNDANTRARKKTLKMLQDI